MSTSYLVNDATQVNQTTTGDQTDASISRLADGGWVVSWSSDDKVYATIYDKDGTAVAQDIDVSQGQMLSASKPVVAGLADGGFAVAWAANDADGLGLIYQTVDSSGNVIGTSMQYVNWLTRTATSRTRPSRR